MARVTIEEVKSALHLREPINQVPLFIPLTLNAVAAYGTMYN